MHRFLLAILLSLSLIGSPVAAAAPAADCAMKDVAAMRHQPAKPSKMDCCTQGCFFTSAALLPEAPGDTARPQIVVAAAWLGDFEEPPSFDPSAVDPPPRSLLI